MALQLSGKHLRGVFTPPMLSLTPQVVQIAKLIDFQGRELGGAVPQFQQPGEESQQDVFSLLVKMEVITIAAGSVQAQQMQIGDEHNRGVSFVVGGVHVHGEVLAKQHRRAQGPGRLARADESRSEEHTSELQSPYVISYAVFCLKK